MNDQNQPAGNWQFQSDDPGQTSSNSAVDGHESNLQAVMTKQLNGDPRTVNWTASEFVAHEKSASWYLILAGITAVVAGLVYIFSKDYISVSIIIMAALLFGVAASRPPRQLAYQVDAKGITIGHRFLPYASFRSFSLAEDGAFLSLEFFPLKRFSLIMTAYFDPQDEAAILGIISDHLPLEQASNDPIERFLRRIRF